MSLRRGRGQLAIQRLQPRDWVLLHVRRGVVQHLHQKQSMVGGGQIILWRRHAPCGRRYAGKKILGSGLMATAGGLLFYGDGNGAFIAADASNGKLLWHFNTSQTWKAGPMTYLADRKS